MKVLLDENLSPALRGELPGHDVTTAVYAGFAGLSNGQLLRVAEEAGFEVFVTGDRNIPEQQNLACRPIAVVALSAHQWTILQEHMDTIRSAVAAARAGTVTRVECGRFSRSRTL